MNRQRAIDAMFEAKAVNRGFYALAYLMSVANDEGPTLREISECLYSLHESMKLKLADIDENLK